MMDADRKSYIESIASQYERGHLREWAHGILSGDRSGFALMCAEDPTVLDVVAAYIYTLDDGFLSLGPDAPGEEGA